MQDSGVSPNTPSAPPAAPPVTPSNTAPAAPAMAPVAPTPSQPGQPAPAAPMPTAVTTSAPVPPPPPPAPTSASPPPLAPETAPVQPPTPVPTPLSPPKPNPARPVSPRENEERDALAHSSTTGIPYFDSRGMTEFEDLESQIDFDTLSQYKVAPIHRYNEHSLELGLTGQTDRSKLPELQQRFPDVQLTFKTISLTGYNLILNHLYYNMFKQERDGDFKLFGKKLSESPPKKAFLSIAQLAYWLEASDIHIEPQEQAARIRFRIDGVLHPISEVNLNSYRIFLSDLQTQANIKWGSDRPQSGRISYRLMSHRARITEVDMRIETIPTFFGEEIVVRLFNNQTQHLQLDELGFTETQAKRLAEITSHPNGMVLTVGPTGSGKTSTLYALINHLNSPEVKIITLEDPVEYELPGISQIPVRSADKELFAEKLRAVLREDPNVIMIGEIRDLDTAKTALQASLTGHLVLSTFHATNAAAAISRMLDMMGTNPLLASAIRLIIAQRLVRRICPHCIQEVTPTPEQRNFMETIVAAIPANRRPTLPKDLMLKHGTGCAYCHGLGYKGRIAIVEMLVVTPDIEKLMTATGQTTARDIESLAVRNGMVTLAEDGLSKVLQNITTVEEIMSLTTE